MAKLVPIREHGGCKICSSSPEKRATADALIVRQGSTDEISGDRITWPWLLERLPLLLGHSVSRSSIRRHVENHCRRVEEEEEAEEEAVEGVELPEDIQAVVDEIDRLQAAGETPSPERVLSLQLSAYLADFRRTLARGGHPPVTHDMAARAAEKLLKNVQDQGRAQLLLAMANAAGARAAPSPNELEEQTAETVPYEIVQPPELTDGGPEDGEGDGDA
ncbi:MAG: hypothetical protein ACRDG7_19600 [Candidatus Limnocylindria bacterium]